MAIGMTATCTVYSFCIIQGYCNTDQGISVFLVGHSVRQAAFSIIITTATYMYMYM